MENGHPYAPQSIVPAEHRQQRQRAQQLDQKGPLEDKSRQAHDAAHRRGGDGVLHGAALLERDVPPGEHQEGHRTGDHPQPADLDQQQYDCLTEGGPVTAGILHHQPRHADSGGGGEQCLMKRRPDPLYCGDRQHQHQRPQQDHARKAEDHNLKRSQMPL